MSDDGSFTCRTCGKKIEEIPAFASDRPVNYWDVPEEKRKKDVKLTSDSCVIADRFFFIRGCLEIPIINREDHFEWGVWVSLKEENFHIWKKHYRTKKRSHIGPFFGWLSTVLPVYPDTQNLKTMVHLRDNGIRPYIELEETDHPLSMEQHRGITMERVHQIIHELEHPG